MMLMCSASHRAKFISLHGWGTPKREGSHRLEVQMGSANEWGCLPVWSTPPNRLTKNTKSKAEYMCFHFLCILTANHQQGLRMTHLLVHNCWSSFSGSSAIEILMRSGFETWGHLPDSSRLLAESSSSRLEGSNQCVISLEVTLVCFFIPTSNVLIRTGLMGAFLELRLSEQHCVCWSLKHWLEGTIDMLNVRLYFLPHGMTT